jgi:predicted amidohydrolase YtcJ
VSDATLLVGGRVFTGRRYCDALLIEDGRVTLAGSEDEVRRASPTGSDRRTLGGSLVVPGLLDAHLHVADVTRFREGLHLGGVDSVDHLVEAIREWASGHPSGSVVGRGWDPERSHDRVWPTRHDLDRAVSDRPVFVAHVSGHAGIANSAALARAGIGDRSPDPVGGRLGRSPDGVVDGRVFERAVREFVGRPDDLDLPSPEALRRTMQWAATFGLTSLGAMSASPEEAVALRGLAAAGELPGRVRVYLHGARWEEYFRGPSGPVVAPDRFAVVGVKEFTDGAFGPRTAWLSAPYEDDPENSGLPVAREDVLRALLAAIAQRSLAPALHAIGDRAVELALDVLGPYARRDGAPARIEHAALTPPSLFPKLARVRPALVVQPGFVWSDHWLAARLGTARARWAYAFRTLGHQGHLLAGSSDAPYDPVDPWRGIRAAVERVDPDGKSANPTPEERLTPEEAIRLYTVNAGSALGEPALGRLEPGSPADLVILTAPSLALAVSAGAAAVQETWVAGALVARGAGSPHAERV